MKTDKINSRKARGNCLLKNLGPNLQEALFEYMDGFGDEQGHTYVQCVAWLKQRGVGTNKSQLSKWRDWYLQRLCFQWCREAVKHMMEDDALEDKYSDEQIQRKESHVQRLSHEDPRCQSVGALPNLHGKQAEDDFDGAKV
jgi:hypothetical protein